MRDTPDDLALFAERVHGSRRAAPERALHAGLNLVNGALRIRSGANGIYGEVQRPVTKPAEAVRAWLRSMEPEIRSGNFNRHHELREAIVAAGEEVDRAVTNVPAASRLRSALYSDAVEVLGGWDRPSSVMPWILVAGLGGIVVGLLVARRKRR